MDGRKIKILISNDDGISAPGVCSLVKYLLANRGEKYDLRVVCPAVQQSSKSHSITVDKYLWAESFTLHPKEMGLEQVKCYHVNGTPVDSVKIALQSDLLGGWKPDLVLSGINLGVNTGLNVHYSGTCGAAREATIYKYPAIALSMDSGYTGSTLHWDTAAEYAVQAIDSLIELNQFQQWATLRVMVNINFPNVEKARIKGWKLTKQGEGVFKDYYKVANEAPENKDLISNVNIILNDQKHTSRKYYLLGGGLADVDVNNLALDDSAYISKYISVSAIPLTYQHGITAVPEAEALLSNWSIFTTPTASL